MRAAAHRIRQFRWTLHHQIAECTWACPIPHPGYYLCLFCFTVQILSSQSKQADLLICESLTSVIQVRLPRTQQLRRKRNGQYYRMKSLVVASKHLLRSSIQLEVYCGEFCEVVFTRDSSNGVGFVGCEQTMVFLSEVRTWQCGEGDSEELCVCVCVCACACVRACVHACICKTLGLGRLVWISLWKFRMKPKVMFYLSSDLISIPAPGLIPLQSVQPVEVKGGKKNSVYSSLRLHLCLPYNPLLRYNGCTASYLFSTLPDSSLQGQRMASSLQHPRVVF